jgi:DNA invertase Pin-like site-specific DNA recombinase
MAPVAAFAPEMPASSLGSFAEFEHGVIRQRVMAGLDRARAKGVRLGRPKLGTEKDRLKRAERLGQEAEIRGRLGSGVSIGRICRELGVGSSTVQRIKREMGAVSTV